MTALKNGPGPGPGPENPGGRREPGAANRTGSRLNPREVALYLRRHWVATLAGLIVVLILAIRFLRHPKAESEDATPAVVTAQTAVARVGDFPVTIDALGTVQPRPGSFAQVAAPAASRVARILVATGDRVRAGQALVELDASVWALQARQARVGLDGAQKAFDRADRLFREGISPRKDVESAATDLARARADLEAAQRTRALATLRSPIAGVVTEMMASLSQPVNENQPLVEVVNPAGLEVLFRLSPTDAARVLPGVGVELTASGTSGSSSATGALSGPVPGAGSLFLGRGVITGVSAAVDSASGGVLVRATVTSPTQPLKAGQTVAGRIVVAHHPRSVIVPLSALVPNDPGFQLFVVDRNNVAHAVAVTVGGRSDTEAEILSGLKGGETVVAGGAYGVTDSSQVRPATAGPVEGAGGRTP